MPLRTSFVVLLALSLPSTVVLAQEGAAKTGSGVTFESESNRPVEAKSNVVTGAKGASKGPESTKAKSAEPVAASRPSSSATAVTKDASGVRHDPKGKRGISPYWEAIRRGDEAALVRDFLKAQAAYGDAIGLEPKNPVAHFRRGQILVREGKLGEAETVYQDATHLSETNSTMHAAGLFVLADLKERQGQKDAALAAWKAYADYLKSQPEAKGYPETPVERDQRIKKYAALVVDGKAVRERIQLRIKEVEEAAKRQATKNPNLNK